jgi:UDPglucose 6-dehydrogenase
MRLQTSVKKLGADVDAVRIGIGTDSRIGKRFLFPGIGYGGSCFPKDVQALYHSGIENSYEFKILKSVMKVNERQKTILLGSRSRLFRRFTCQCNHCHVGTSI